MKLARVLRMSSATFAFLASAASAVPITFQLDNVTQVGGSNPSAQTYVPGFPLAGSGNLDFGAGTGTLSLPDYSVFVDVGFNGDDVRLDITGWTQSITTDTSYLVILDAANVTAEPLAEIHIPARVVAGFHSSWIPDEA